MVILDDVFIDAALHEYDTVQCDGASDEDEPWEVIEQVFPFDGIT